MTTIRTKSGKDYLVKEDIDLVLHNVNRDTFFELTSLKTALFNNIGIEEYEKIYLNMKEIESVS